MDSNSSHDTAWLFLTEVTIFGGKLSWDVTITQVNSALHPSRDVEEMVYQCVSFGK